MWLPAENADEKFKQDAQTQDADGMQTLSVLYTTLSEAILQQ